MKQLMNIEFKYVIIALLIIGAIVCAALGRDYVGDFIGGAFLVWIFAK